MAQTILTRSLGLACFAGLALAPLPGAAAQSRQAVTPNLSAVQLAANADHPYSNIDRSNDAGNNTGDAEVERLNEGQLDQNYRGPNANRPTMAAPAYPPPPGYAPPPGYPPPPGYAPSARYAPPPGYATPPGYTPPSGYAPPPGYAPPARYAPPSGYAPQPGYPPPPGYASPPGQQAPGY